MGRAGVAVCLMVFVIGAGRPGFGEQGHSSEVRVVSSFAPAGAKVPAECGREVTVLAEALSALPHVMGWHWVVVCDEAGWRRFERASDQLGRGEIYASTDLATATTFVRGAKLLDPATFRPGAREVIAHEVAHVLLNSGSEEEADRLSSHWEPGQVSLAAVEHRWRSAPQVERQLAGPAE